MNIGAAWLLTLASAFIAAPAYADWETTRWGMSPKVAMAGLHSARAHDPAPNEIYEEGGKRYAPRVMMPHEVEGVEGRASLLFDAASRLRSVVFSPADIKDCKRLSTALTKRHGRGERLESSVMSIADWSADGNAIKLTHSERAKICNLSYSPARP